MRIPKSLADKKVLALIILALSLSVLLVDIDKPSEIWDERARYVAGLNQVYNIVQGRFDSDSWRLNYYHPPIGKYLYGAVNGAYLYTKVPNLLSLSYDQALQILDETKNLLPGRILAVILGSLSVVFTFLIGYDFIDKRIGVAAALILLFTPAFIAHVKVENLEAPLLFFFLATVYTFLKAASKGGNSKYYIISAVLAGLAIGTKLNNAALVFLLPAFYIFLNHKLLLKDRMKFFKNIPRNIWLFPVIAVLVFFITWPWLWSDPVGNLQASLSWWTYHPTEYFLGNLTTAPFDYYLVYFFATIPVVFIIFFLVPIFRINNQEKFTKLALLWFAISIILFSLTQFKQNGTSYIISIYPAFAILAASGLLAIYEAHKHWHRNFGKIFLILLAAYTAISLLTVHPYYLDYYNELTGGPENVYKERLFIIGYQGEGLGEAVSYINKVAPENSRVEFHFVPSHLSRNLRSDISDLNPPEKSGGVVRLSNITIADQNLHGADFVVENTYFKWYFNGTFDKVLSDNSYELDKTVTASGAPLVWVYKKKV